MATAKVLPLSFQLLLGDRYEDDSGQSRISIVLLLLLLLTPHIEAKNKKEQLPPDYVLRAERVLVVNSTRRQRTFDQSTANRTAQEVETAIMK